MQDFNTIIDNLLIMAEIYRIKDNENTQKELFMDEKLEAMETVSVEDALQMEIIVNQALIDILVEKGIFTEQELMNKIEVLKKNQHIISAE